MRAAFRFLVATLPLGSLAQGPVMEIEFEPAGLGPEGMAPPQALLDMMAAMNGQQPSHGRARREDQLDQAIRGTLSGLAGGAPARSRQQGAGPRTRSWRSPDGTQEVMIQEIGPGIDMPHSSVPVSLFRDLFPGPLLAEAQGAPDQGMPFAAPDPLIMDMLQELGEGFQEAVLPTVHGHGGGSRAPRSCFADLQKHCSKERSQIHCLGQHREDISEACRTDVGKSVPFICSKAIDQYCDVLQRGILSCLGDRLKDLDGQCMDAVIATQHVIAKASTQKASVKETDGARKEPLSAVAMLATQGKGSTSDREANLDAQIAGGPAKANAGATLLDSAAAIVAEAKKVAGVGRVGQAAAEGGLLTSWRTIWMGLALAAFASLACAFTGGESPRTVNQTLKSYMNLGEEGKQPLRAGLELPKSV